MKEKLANLLHSGLVCGRLGFSVPVYTLHISPALSSGTQPPATPGRIVSWTEN